MLNAAKFYGAKICGVVIIFCSVFSFSARAEKKNVINLQPRRMDTILDITSIDQKSHGFVRLINLNPEVNMWFLLEVTWPGEEKEYEFHLENVDPTTNVILDKDFSKGLKFVSAQGIYQCDLWTEAENSPLRGAVRSQLTYAPICDNRLFVRNKTVGKETTKEWVADFLRQHVWAGDKITNMVKSYLSEDKYLLVGKGEKREGDKLPPVTKLEERPDVALLAPENQKVGLDPKDLGIAVKEMKDGMLLAGQWYGVQNLPNVYVSVAQIELLDKGILKSFPSRVRPIDGVESKALSYLIAYNLDHFNLGFAMGTSHPSVEWSDRIAPSVRVKDWPGPDGIGDLDPLIMTGKVNPKLSPRVISAFTGGFKRTHGAFKWGNLATQNFGSHYGFLEAGVVFSRLNPSLATILIHKDQRVEMRTWTDKDRDMQKNLIAARQNGIPILEWDEASKAGIPHPFVGNWSLGNWSGSQDSKQRALRAGLCLQSRAGKKFLIYGYFSSHTANGIARIFQAYRCDYALHLDMNALEHTYLAIYERGDKKFKIQHLIQGMEVLDQESKGHAVPRFIGTADNRDFFYIWDKVDKARE